MRRELETRQRAFGFAAAAFLVLVLVAGAAWLLYRKEHSDKIDLRVAERGIAHDVVAGMGVDAAKSILIEKYRASLVEDKSGGGHGELSFNISSPSDARGVSQVLVVIVNLDDQKVRSVETEIGGIGP
jgi:hypothetical protein